MYISVISGVGVPDVVCSCVRATKMGEKDSAFPDVWLSTLSNGTRALAEIIIAAVKRIEHVVAGHSKGTSALTATSTDLQSRVETKAREIADMLDCFNILEDKVDSNSAYTRWEYLVVSGGVLT